MLKEDERKIIIEYMKELDKLIDDYEPQYKILISQAFSYAYKVHKGVLRKSGEPYIIHPLAVACILAEMKADADTIAAGLLHDTIEDGQDITREDLAKEFNPTIAMLVDGVTNMKKVNFNNDKRKAHDETNRKIIESIVQDIRILIIKLADRLHNMRTMEYQTPEKQIEKSRETMEFYVPLAEHIGEYTFKKDLEDLSFKYLNPEKYKEVFDLREQEKIKYDEALMRTHMVIYRMLLEINGKTDLDDRVKNIKSLSDKLDSYGTIDKVHDLFEYKVILPTAKDCYDFLDKIIEMYFVDRDKMKDENHFHDYIANPKDNMYSSIHISVMNKAGRMIQFQIKTREMFMVNSYGLPAYWSLMGLNHPEIQMQRDVSNFKFFKKIKEIMDSNLPTSTFNSEVNELILQRKIKVYDENMEMHEVPVGSTPIDYYYLTCEEPEDFICALIKQKNSDEEPKRVPLNYELQPRDVVTIVTKKNLYGPQLDIIGNCKKEHTKNRILKKI